MRPTIDTDQFIAKVNAKMREHPGYIEGMGVQKNERVVMSPLGTTVVGPLPLARSVATWAQKVTLQRYDVRVTH